MNPNGKNIENWMVEVSCGFFFHENICVGCGQTIHERSSFQQLCILGTVNQLLRELFLDLAVAVAQGTLLYELAENKLRTELQET